MKNEISRVAVLALGLVFGPLAASAAPVEFDGHLYTVIKDEGVSWQDAKNAVALLPAYNGFPAHLATIISEDEDDFINTLRLASGSNHDGGFINSELWVGGVQPAGSLVNEDWEWDNGDGDIPGTNPDAASDPYANWDENEPNDAGTEESHLAVGIYNRFAWNDEGNLAGIYGYVVEWDTDEIVVDVSDCALSPEGCQTIPGHFMTFPEGSVGTSPNVTIEAIEFEDDISRCDLGEDPLILFGDDSVDDNELIIPPYLCGSPDFVVMKLESSDIDIQDGTVSVENDTATVLPGNAYADGGKSVCEDLIIQDPYIDGDPQYQDVIVWQTTNPREMLEFNSNVSGIAQFAGAAGEFSDRCGSSRGRVKGGSYYVVGMHINFGPGNTWALNSAGNFDKFVELTRYKLTLLSQSVEDAYDADALTKKGDYKKMRNMAANAIKNLDRGNFDAAYDLVTNFLKFVNRANYVDSVENFNGEHLMRGSNIEFMLRVKIIPYASEVAEEEDPEEEDPKKKDPKKKDPKKKDPKKGGKKK